jgi:streptogramin lyase
VGNSNDTVSTLTTAGANEQDYTLDEETNAIAQDAEIDGSGNVWVSNYHHMALLKLNSSTGAIIASTTPGALTIRPYSLAIEPNTGNVWVADGQYSNADVLSSAPATGTVPTGTAIDASGNVWFANGTGINAGAVTALTSAGIPLTGSPFNTGNAQPSDGVAIDGLGNVWVSNSLGGAVYELNNAGGTVSPAAGYIVSNPAIQPDGIAIDGSGNVWYNSATLVGGNSGVLYELVGAAAPVVTPLSNAVALNQLGVTP